MFGQLLSNLFSEPAGTLRKRLQSHYTSAFRVLLLGGISFLLVGLLTLEPIFEQHKGFYLWLAGFAATLGMSFIFAIVSTQINGYRRYKDTVLGFATGMMFLLSGILVVAGLFHM
jgi:hypothetical protein